MKLIKNLRKSGEDGIPAKLLKDCVPQITKLSKWISYYVEIIKHMRTMYQVCKLVHGDLSEFNILLHKQGKLYLVCFYNFWKDKNIPKTLLENFENNLSLKKFTILEIFIKVCYIIDVSQSVEHDHPFALDFLRFDCRNVNGFFSKQQANGFDWVLEVNFIKFFFIKLMENFD